MGSLSLSAGAEAVTPRVSLAPGSLVFALAIYFPEAVQKQSVARHHFFLPCGLAELGLFEGLALHNELSLKVHLHILAAIRQRITFQWVSNALMQIPAFRAFILKTMTFPQEICKNGNYG